MGTVFSSCRCRNRNKREITLLMIGLDNAGKTTTTKHLLGESLDDVVPTIGFSSVQVKQNQFDITIFDLGGGSKIRGIWKNYYALVHGIIYVIDASDAQRVDECRKEISIVLQDNRIAGKPILLLVNKQDIQGALDEAEICTSLELEAMVNEQQCPTRVETCTAININGKRKDKGIEKGFQWLLGHIEKHYSNLQQRVEQETNQQKEREAQERAERLERVRKIREEREKQEMELRAVEGKGDNVKDDDDDDVIIGTPFKSAAKIREELKEKEALEAKITKSPGDGKIIYVSPKNAKSDAGPTNVKSNDSPTNAKSDASPTNDKSDAKRIESSQSDVGSPVSGSEYEKGITSSADMDSDINLPHNGIVQTDEELMDGRKKVKRKPHKRFKNKVSPGTEIDKPRDLPPLPHVPLSPSTNSWLVNSEETKFLSNGLKSERINWALAEELLPCEDNTESKTLQNENKWIQPELRSTDSPCKR